jgi:hypothetical protein
MSRVGQAPEVEMRSYLWRRLKPTLLEGVL